jgi:hypothetical protein
MRTSISNHSVEGTKPITDTVMMRDSGGCANGCSTKPQFPELEILVFYQSGIHE